MSNLVPITVAHGDGIGHDGIDVYVAWPSLNGEVGYTLAQGQ